MTVLIVINTSNGFMPVAGRQVYVDDNTSYSYPYWEEMARQQNQMNILAVSIPPSREIFFSKSEDLGMLS